MSLTDKINSKIAEYIRHYVNVYKDINHFCKLSFGAKKILIISEKNISNIPISPRFQVFLTFLAACFMLWVSYSTGKYFAYEDIILEKDREIWSTNVTNENLQYQVADLHKNLKELNKYFENIRRYDQISQTAPTTNNQGAKSSSEEETHVHNDETASIGAQKILYNIRGKVIERIDSLENVIKMTGLNVDKIADNNHDFKQAKTEMNGKVIPVEANSNQGGPYEPVSGSIQSSVFNKEDFDSEVNYLIKLEEVIHSMPLSAPLDQYWLSSGFGVRVDPIRRHMAVHNGLDLVGNFNAKVFTSAPGVVIYSGSYGAYGKFIEVDHGSGITTRYGHLNKVLVTKGDEVRRHQLIGLQGNTGRSTGTHLHYEVRLNGKPYDPANFLKAGAYVF